MKSESGFTLIELVVVVVLLSILTIFIGAYLSSQWRYANETTAKTQMQTSMRSAMELISVDIQNAGSKGVNLPCVLTGAPLVLDTSTPLAHEITLRYCDPYTFGERVVRYLVQPDPSNDNLPTLFREVNGSGAEPAIAGIRALEFDLVCDPSGATLGAPDYRCDLASYDPGDIIEATVKVGGQNLESLRQVDQAFTFDGTTVAAPSGFYYDYAEQRVSPPNLRGRE